MRCAPDFRLLDNIWNLEVDKRRVKSAVNRKSVGVLLLQYRALFSDRRMPALGQYGTKLAGFVRYWPIADVPAALRYVRFERQSGHSVGQSAQ
jgi:hypothetical protein